jgi:hypothetical protein
MNRALPPPRNLLRTAVIIVAALVLLWLSTVITLALVARERAPMGFPWWTGTDARVAAASSVALDPRSRDFARARRLAIAALNREPVNVGAARSLALVEDRMGHAARAARLFRYAESLSRRDLLTQLWLIETNVRRNDIPETLRHYDRAMRTSATGIAQLTPILVAAAADPAIRRDLVPLVARRPPWWTPFMIALISDSQSGDALYDLVRSVRLDMRDGVERAMMASALQRLVDLRSYDRAQALYRAARGTSANGALLRDGGFEQDSLLPPFDWAYTDQDGLAATRRTNDRADGNALYLLASAGRTGVAARQLVLLPPGRYRLAGRAGDVPSGDVRPPKIAVRCLGDLRPALIELAMTPGAATRFGGTFAVPAGGCPAQMLEIRPPSSLDENVESWVDSIALARIGS